jgi:hypothetical protein
MLPSLQRYEIGTSEFDPFRRSIPSPWSTLVCIIPLYGVDFVKGVPQVSYPFILTSVSLFDLGSRFFAPTHSNEKAGARRSGQGWRVSATEGSSLDGFEHGGTLGWVGMTTFEGSPACGARISCHILVCGGPEARTMMQ